MTKEELEKENEELKKLVERLKEENKNWELRYNSVKIELELRIVIYHKLLSNHLIYHKLVSKENKNE